MTDFAVPFVYPDHGVLSVFTRSNDGANTWRNSIDLVWADADGPPAYSTGVVAGFVSFLQGIQRDDCTIIKASLVPYSKGNVPFDLQGNIWEQTLNLPCKNWGTGSAHPGNTGSGTTPLGELCILMVKGKFGPGGGKPGRLFLRNAVDQAWVKADAGGPPVLVTPGATTVIAETNDFASAKLSSYCEANPLPRFTLVHAGVTAKDSSGKPTHYNVFDTEVSVPIFDAMTMHDISKK